MPNDPTTEDYREIWLEPRPGGDPHHDRQWCRDDVWTDDPDYADDGPPTRYIRADLFDQLRAALERIIAEGPPAQYERIAREAINHGQ